MGHRAKGTGRGGAGGGFELSLSPMRHLGAGSQANYKMQHGRGG